MDTPKTIPFGSKPLAKALPFGSAPISQPKETSTASTATPPSAQPPSNGPKGGFVGEALTGSTQRFGKTVGEALAAPGNANLYADSMDQHTAIQSNLMKAIREKKKLGQDTSRLETALQHHVQDTPKLEDFTGDVINKSTESILGEAGGTVLEALSGGTLGGGAATVADKSLTTLQKVKQGAKIGSIYGAASGATGAMQEDQSASGVLDSTLAGGAIGGSLGAGLGSISSLASKKASSVGNKIESKAETAAGQILQGEKDDVKNGIKILSKLDTKGVKTYDDLNQVLDKKIKTLSETQDLHLGKDQISRKLGQLNGEIKVGDKTVKHNYVHDAINQLQQFYKKTNNVAAEQEIAQLRTKAAKQGLTNNELNSLAKLHGRDLNGFNANGELASGLSKQSAENTRKGLKSTLRAFTKDPISKQIDDEISRTIKVKDLTDEVSRKVNDLQQKIQPYTIGEKVGSTAFRIANLFTGGGLKGAVAAALPRGVGYKTLNALDLEENLTKNLKIIDKINTVVSSGESKESVLQKIEKILNQELNLSNQSSKAGESKVSNLTNPTTTHQPTKMNNNVSMPRNVSQKGRNVKKSLRAVKEETALYPKKYDVKKGSATWQQKMRDIKRDIENE